MITPMVLRALQYVVNTNGGATLAAFIDDHEPIGQRLWDQIRGERPGGPALAELGPDGRLRLTEDGNTVLAEAQPEGK